jgi:leader peptidase (prepilin peptidase)/N-methyltransferase
VFSGTLRDDRARQFETLWGEGAARSRDVERRPARRGVNVGAALVAFVPGLAVGSFLNVVTSRLPAGRSIVRPRSACPSCEAPIAARDNIPVISYVLLRGRCRSCGAPISWKYPVVELLTASLIAACALVYGFTFEAAIAAFFCTVLVAVSVTDIERFVIPNRIVVPAAAVVLVAQTINEPSPEWFLAGFGAALFLFIAALVYPAGMGMGDVKLALLLGFMLGRTVPVALMVGTIAALVPSIVLIARHGSAARKMRIPFGPFLAFGGIVALFFGDAIVDAYLGML